MRKENPVSWCGGSLSIDSRTRASPWLPALGWDGLEAGQVCRRISRCGQVAPSYGEEKAGKVQELVRSRPSIMRMFACAGQHCICPCFFW